MKVRRSWILAVGATLGLMSVGFPGAGAHSFQRPSRDGRFFQGHGGGVHGPFRLHGGKYVINVWANYNSGYDPANAGQCIFTAYLNGVEQPAFLSLATAAPVLPSAPYHATIPVTATPGHYKLIVSPVSDCDWSMIMLSSGPAAPGVEILAAQPYLNTGTSLTPKFVVHMGETFFFSAVYRMVGGLQGKPTGTFTLQEHANARQNFPLFLGKDFDGVKQMYINQKFAPKYHDTLGPAVGKFTITVGSHHVSKSVKFTIVR